MSFLLLRTTVAIIAAAMLCALAGGCVSTGESGSTTAQSRAELHSEIDFRTATKACMQELGLASSPSEEPSSAVARPDHGWLQVCLKGKGFEPPSSRHAAWRHDPAIKAAFKACAAEQGVELPEGEAKEPTYEKKVWTELDRGKLDACLKGMGVAPPPAVHDQ